MFGRIAPARASSGNFKPCPTPFVPSFARRGRYTYFTNAGRVMESNPYAVLGLEWGDGSTTKDIQAAFRRQAAILHPDVNQSDSPTVALQKFQALQKAYEKLTKIHNSLPGLDPEKDGEWRASVYLRGDRIAVDRTDVAGVKKVRPIEPAKHSFSLATLGHPSGSGKRRSGELLGVSQQKPTSSVGRGQSKWVKPVAYKPWQPRDVSKVSTKNVDSENSCSK